MRPTSSASAHVLALVVAFLNLSCGAARSASQTTNIFGGDDRVDVDPASLPGSAVGRIDSGCTGTLIGERLVLTAAHCIIDTTNRSIKPLVTFFRPAFNRGAAPDALWIQRVWLGSEQPETERPRDWAVLLLDRVADARFGKLSVRAVDFTEPDVPSITLVGYSTDRDSGNSASQHRGCAVREVNAGRLFHDCDGASGVSGGPLLMAFDDGLQIAGVTVSEFRRGAPGSVTRDAYSAEYANVGVPATTFAPAVAELVGTVDRGAPAPTLDGVTVRDNPNPRPGDPGPTRTLQDVRPASELAGRAERVAADARQLARDAFDLADLGEQYRANDLHFPASDLYRAGGRLERVAERIRSGTLRGEGARRDVFTEYEDIARELGNVSSFDGWRSRPELQSRLDRFLERLRQAFSDIEREVFLR